jgi:hypothetical protein
MERRDVRAARRGVHSAGARLAVRKVSRARRGGARASAVKNDAARRVH